MEQLVNNNQNST